MSIVLVWFFIFGTIIGSFLNVVIYRFNTGKSLSGRSHCLSCGTFLSWYELAPVLSYVLQKGKCRSCKAHITPRYLVVELLTGLLFLLTAQKFLFDPVLLVLNLGIVSLLVIILVYDLRHTIIPDQLVVYFLVLALVYMLRDQTSWTVGALLGGLTPSAFFGGLWLISRGRWIGLGDAKLAVPLGLILGIRGSISMLLFAFWIGAIVSVSLLAIQYWVEWQKDRSQRQATSARGRHVPKGRFPFLSRRLTMKSEIPFAPFLICAFFLVQLMGADVFAVTGMAFP